MRDEAITFHHYPESHVFVSGIPRFDHHFQPPKTKLSREEFLLQKKLDPNKKTLLYTSVPSHVYKNQLETVGKLLEFMDSGKIKEKMNLLIRIHPRDEREAYKIFEGRLNVHVEYAGAVKSQDGINPHKIEMDQSDKDNLRYTFLYSDINVNFRSSISIEAPIYDHPIINPADHGYEVSYAADYYEPILKSGGMWFTKSYDDLAEAINAYLDNPRLHSEGRKKIVNQFVQFTDGLSAKRNVGFLENIFGIIGKEHNI